MSKKRNGRGRGDAPPPIGRHVGPGMAATRRSHPSREGTGPCSRPSLERPGRSGFFGRHERKREEQNRRSPGTSVSSSSGRPIRHGPDARAGGRDLLENPPACALPAQRGGPETEKADGALVHRGRAVRHAFSSERKGPSTLVLAARSQTPREGGAEMTRWRSRDLDTGAVGHPCLRS